MLQTDLICKGEIRLHKIDLTFSFMYTIKTRMIYFAPSVFIYLTLNVSPCCWNTTLHYEAVS